MNTFLKSFIYSFIFIPLLFISGCQKENYIIISNTSDAPCEVEFYFKQRDNTSITFNITTEKEGSSSSTTISSAPYKYTLYPEEKTTLDIVYKVSNVDIKTSTNDIGKYEMIEYIEFKIKDQTIKMMPEDFKGRIDKDDDNNLAFDVNDLL